MGLYILRLRVGMSMIPGRTVTASSRIYSALNFDMMKCLPGPRYYLFLVKLKILLISWSGSRTIILETRQ